MKTPPKKHNAKHRGMSALAVQLLLITSAHAILDVQNNGMSDLWEKQYNNGNLFLASFLPTDDPDQDGWTNATEAVAGTDPHLANPPDGIIATTIEPTTTVGTFTLTWNTIVGKNYRLQASSNLTNWLNVGTNIVGTSNSHTLGISAVQPDTTVPPKLFWRVVASDLDNDGDGLTNAEENALGTDPEDADTDGDGIIDSQDINVITFNSTIKATLISDLNNNGEITEDDIMLRDASFESSATNEAIQMGTEYIFQNDSLSNGKWDKEDSDPLMPSTEVNDDDAEEIVIEVVMPDGEVWLDHPAISLLSFYKTRECKPEDKINMSPSSKYSLTAANPLPEKIYMRADGNMAYSNDDPQFKGDLVLKVKTNDSNQEYEGARLKLTIVKHFGAANYFQATRDYILENNTLLMVQDRTFTNQTATSTYRLCLMLEELTKLNPFESYYDDVKENWLDHGLLSGEVFEATKFTSFGLGIDGAIAADNQSTVVINGNQCDFVTTALPNPLDVLGRQQRLAALTAMSLADNPQLTDVCHGRLHAIPPGWPVSRKNPSSSDHDDPDSVLPGTHLRGSYLAGNDPVAGSSTAGGKCFIQYDDDSFVMSTGRVPDETVNHKIHGAIGGLSGNYSSEDRNNYPNSLVGYFPSQASTSNTKTGIVFVAMGKGTQGKGMTIDLYNAAKKSGLPDLPSATADEAGKSVINLLFLDSGLTSCALAHKNPSDTFFKVYEGDKHRGFPYYTNTFLRFATTRPRN